MSGAPTHMQPDERTRRENVTRGNPLCERCGGTGNELLSMYRRCADCRGTGIKDYLKPVPVYKLSPELCDGEHWIVANTPAEVAEAVKIWAENTELLEDGFDVSVIKMSRAQQDALPDI